jgi:hypothetical protein
MAGRDNVTGESNTYMGLNAGLQATGSFNTFVGSNAGDSITTGAKNSILGRYNGNQGGLDIRTSNNNIVLSDGDGNPRLVGDNLGNFGLGAAPSPTLALNSLQIGRAQFSGWAGVDYVVMSSNCYYTGTGGLWNYISSDAASRFSASGSGFSFALSPSGTAGANAPFTDVLNVSLGGSLALRGAVSQTGTGITFPATQSASSNANTLDDYEEGSGTFSSVQKDAVGAAVSLSTNEYQYTKIGRFVYLSFRVLITTPTAATVWRLNGLPFTNFNSDSSIGTNLGPWNGMAQKVYGQSSFIDANVSDPSGTTSNWPYIFGTIVYYTS